MKKHSKYQERAIKSYYQNREAIALQRAQELVTELYLTEGKQRQRHWKSLAGHLEKLGVAPSQIEHLRSSDKPELVARLLKSLVDKS